MFRSRDLLFRYPDVVATLRRWMAPKDDTVDFSEGARSSDAASKEDHRSRGPRGEGGLAAARLPVPVPVVARRQTPLNAYSAHDASRCLRSYALARARPRFCAMA